LEAAVIAGLSGDHCGAQRTGFVRGVSSGEGSRPGAHLDRGVFRRVQGPHTGGEKDGFPPVRSGVQLVLRLGNGRGWQKEVDAAALSLLEEPRQLLVAVEERDDGRGV
jgi:hypothetical protein